MFTGIYYQKRFSPPLLAKTIIKEFQDSEQNLRRKLIFRPNHSNFITDGKCQVAFFSSNFALSLDFTLEVIIDYGSAFVTYGKITETKSSRNESSFPAEVPLIKLIGQVICSRP